MGINANDKHSNADTAAVGLLKNVLDNVISSILEGKSFELQFVNAENVSTDLCKKFPCVCRYNFRLLDPVEEIKNGFFDDDDDDGDDVASNSTKDIAKVHEELATIQTQIRQLYGAMKNIYTCDDHER